MYIHRNPGMIYLVLGFDIKMQADEREKDELKVQIETAIAALNDPQSPMSM